LNQPFTISTPGRICLFGEHQDYLGLSVISMAVNLRVYLTARPRRDDVYRVRAPMLGIDEEFRPANGLALRHGRDYVRSAINVLKRRGLTFERGCDFTVNTQLPLNAGVASSSALIIAWIAALLHLHDRLGDFTSEELARLAHEAEVVEFGGPGGIMDHYICTLGGTLHIDCGEPIRVTPLAKAIGDIVIGDSLEEKNTTTVLAEAKSAVLDAIRLIKKKLPDFDLRSCSEDTVIPLLNDLPERCAKALYACMANRDICRTALEMMQEPAFDQDLLGEMMDNHHSLLRDNLNVSTERIERLISAAKDAGALGCKINGSGGGGTMIAYAPGRAETIAQAIIDAGGQAYIVKKDTGVRIEDHPGDGRSADADFREDTRKGNTT